MTASTSRKADRELLLGLVEALSVSPGRLRRDPCGDWIITGTRGHVLTNGINAFAYVAPGTARRWNKVKRTLQFMLVTQDGDTGGMLRMPAMPTAEQAATIRQVLGMRMVTPMTDERREVLARTSFGRDKTPVQAPSIDFSEAPAPQPQETGFAQGGRQ